MCVEYGVSVAHPFDIAEILAFNKVLSDQEIIIIEDALMIKYGIIKNS
jgi:hypothetical protein